MNVKHIQYIVEIERVSSISQAAENLYIGQPNLSRILKEVETDIGFPIFLRTTHGVKPTERGAVFLQHAHNILREVENIQMMGHNQPIEDRMRICMPRTVSCFQFVANFLKTATEQHNVQISVFERHAKETLDMLSAGQAEIGIIRFRTGYDEYFLELALSGKLSFRMLTSYEDRILMHKNHILADSEKIHMDALKQCVLIAHSDDNFIHHAVDEKTRSRIYTIDRYTQFHLLETIPGSYMWSPALTQEELLRYNLVQKQCSDHAKQYCEALIFNPQSTKNSLESTFIKEITEYYQK